jgi:hypothetical protein
MNVIETLRSMPIVLQAIAVFPLCLAIYVAMIFAVNITASIFIYMTRGKGNWLQEKYNKKIKEIEKKKRY